MTLVILKQDQGFIAENGKRAFGKKGEEVNVDHDFLGLIKGKYDEVVDTAALEAEEKAKKEAEELAALEAEEKAKKEAEELAALEAEEKAKKSKKS